jgi:hypothetical protein
LTVSSAKANGWGLPWRAPSSASSADEAPSTERRGNFRERSRDTISRQPNDAACVAITAAAATVDVSAARRRVSAMRATITHVIEVARRQAREGRRGYARA